MMLRHLAFCVLVASRSLGCAASRRGEVAGSLEAGLVTQSSVPADQKIYVVVNLRLASDSSFYHLEVPEGGCSKIKCRIGGKACTFRLELSPLFGPLVTTHARYGDSRQHFEELKGLVVKRMQGVIESYFDSNSVDPTYLDDFNGPVKVEPAGFTEHWKWLYRWTVMVPSLAQTYKLNGCNLRVVKGGM